MLNLTAAGGSLRRRDVLRIGGLGALGAGIGLPDLLASGPKSTTGKARSCIVVFLAGGPAQHSTWDPKPDAPQAVRGAYGPIATSVPGLSISELMPRLAEIAHKLCVLRAVSTGDNGHSSSGYYMLTGRPHSPRSVEGALPGPPNDGPGLGAVVGKFTPPGRGKGLPPAVTLPQRIFNTGGNEWLGQDAGFLGRAADPWLLHAELLPTGYRIGEISLPEGLAVERVESRRALSERIARRLAFLDHDATATALDLQTRQALDLLRSPQARGAFRLEDEPDVVHDRYGRTPIGQGCLFARRLVEAGVRLVQVNWYRGPDEPPSFPIWDTHGSETSRLKDALVPPTDRALAALIGDLDGRGMLDETLVVCMSEFGRSPQLVNDGRGHWGAVFSVAMAGGGLRGGQVHGASDHHAAYPREGRVIPEDLHATILHQLGVAPDALLFDNLGRPHPVSRGEVVQAVL